MSRSGTTFAKGDEHTRAMAQKAAKASAIARARPARRETPYRGTLLDLMDEIHTESPQLFGPTFAAWRVLWKAALGMSLTDGDGAELQIFQRHTGRKRPPTRPVRELWIVAGRRAGKSVMCALKAVHRAISYDGRHAPGETLLIPVTAGSEDQSKVVFSYVRQLSELKTIQPWVESQVQRQREIMFRTGVTIAVRPASFRTLRGPTVVDAIADEVAFWFTEVDDSRNPDVEIIRSALIPAMLTVRDAMLVCISSPYSRRGELWDVYDRYYAVDDERTLVWNSDSISLNPTIPADTIDQEFERDPTRAASEYGTAGTVSFRRDVEAFLDVEAVNAVTIPGRHELPPVPGIHYYAFVDASGLRGDAFPLAIAHRETTDEGKRYAVLDLIRERRPPMNGEAVVEEFAGVCRQYGITRVCGDRYAGDWVAQAFERHGMKYDRSERDKSTIFTESIGPVNSGQVELLDSPVLRTQLVGLERRVSRGGKDSIAKGAGGRDDVANAACGALLLALGVGKMTKKRYHVTVGY